MTLFSLIVMAACVKPTPVETVDAEPDPVAIALAVDSGFACAAPGDGSLWCWGDNSRGQLGTGDEHPRDGPVRVPLDEVVDVSAGTRMACAVAGPERRVFCWGENRPGGVGVQAGPKPSPPVELPGVSGVELLSVNGEASCAVNAAKEAWCWGDHPWSSVDERGRRDGLASISPVRVPDLDGATDLSIGSEVCGLLPERGLVCFTPAYDATQVVDDRRVRLHLAQEIPGLAAAEQVDSWVSTSCALQAGAVWCWKSGRGEPAAPKEIPLRGPAISVAVFDEVCAQLETGAVQCFDVDHRDLTIEDQPEIVGITQIALGRDFGCGVRSDEVVCWGNNYEGQLASRSEAASQTPVRVEGLADVVQISVQDDRTCAVGRAGALWCWGDTVDKPREIPVDAVAVSTSGSHSCALDTDGAVWCWKGYSAPVKVDGIGNATSIATDDNRTCVVTADGEVWCWGSVTLLLRDLTEPGERIPSKTEVPVRIPWATDAVEVVLGPTRGCVRSGDGTHRCWGWRRPTFIDAVGLSSISLTTFGGCGLLEGAVSCWSFPSMGETQERLAVATAGAWKDVVHLDTSRADACVVHGDGTVGCVQVNLLRAPDGVPDLIPVPGLDGVVSLDQGGYHLCALTDTGDVWCWGDNKKGQLGVGAESTAFVEKSVRPVVIEGLR